MSSSPASHQDFVLFDPRDSYPLEPGRTRLLVILVAMLAALALCLSSYLTWTTWTATPVAGCGTGGIIECDHVLSSPWSKWLGQPVSLLGVLVYAGILATCGIVAKRGAPLAWTALVTLSLMAAGSALWFIGLQAVVLGSFCLYCLGVHACGLAIGVLMVLLVCERGRDDNDEHMRMLLGTTHTPAPLAATATSLSEIRPLAAAGAAAVGLALLMVGQLFLQPAGLVLEKVDAPAPSMKTESLATELSDSPVASPTAEEAAPPSTEVAATEVEPATAEAESAPVSLVPGYKPPSRVIAFKGLNESIDVCRVPIIGDPKAKNIVVEMIDYTCTHCRHFHPNIHQVLERYGDQVAFVVQHVPLSKKCNPHVQVDTAIHKYACDYARLSLGVWKLAPGKWVEYHDWLMKSEKPPSVFAARQEAMRLAGEAVLLDDNLKADSFRSFAGNSDEVMQLNSGLPVLLTEFGVIRGVPRTEKELFQFLEELLDIKPLPIESD